MSESANTAAETTRVVQITPEAVTEVVRLMKLEKEQNLYLRIGVAAGGCSGMSYSMAFDTDARESDVRYDYSGLQVLIDRQAAPYLEGAKLDYKGGLLGGGFEFTNPRAKRSCGCGSSFTV